MALVRCHGYESDPWGEELARFPENWAFFRLPAGWVAVEPSTGWYQIGDLPPDILDMLPPRAGRLGRSEWILRHITLTLPAMPGNARDLEPGWSLRAMTDIERYLTALEGQNDTSPVQLKAGEQTPETPATQARPKRRRTDPALKEHRLVLENDLAGFFPKPDRARKRIEQEIAKLGVDRVMDLLKSNPATFADPHPRHLRWVARSLSDNLRKLEELLP